MPVAFPAVCRVCGGPIDEVNAAFEGCRSMCFDCWTEGDMGETGYEGDKMLTPEQVAKIRRHWNVDGASHVAQLLRDRAEIAQELERIRDTYNNSEATDKALTALIERIGK